MSNLGQLSRLFDACLEQPITRRLEFARELCGDDQALLKTLIELLNRDKALETAGNHAESGLVGLAGLAFSERMMKGLRIGAFEVEECIGTGGMGSVYRVRRVDGEVQQLAALKILKPMVAESSLFERFSNERRLLAGLTHPGICRFLDAGNLPDGQPYVLMELVEGVPLTTWCDQKRLGLHDRIRLFVEVLDAVAYAHRNLVVHRDIKPSNLLVSADGKPCLLDFGIAKHIGLDNPDLTGTAERYLTPAAAAPEQYLGQRAGVGCDIYALGQVLYELLCGSKPFDFSSARAAEVERQLLHMPAPSMLVRLPADDQAVAQMRGLPSQNALRRALRGDLDTIVLKCLRKSPEERYPSVEQLQSELRRVLLNRPIRARRGERWYRLRKFMVRNRVPAGLGLLLGLSLLGSLAMSLVHSSRMVAERSLAVIERDRAQYAITMLQQAFSGADPTRTLGAEVTARQILESARQPLEVLEQNQPALFATLASVIGEVELDLMMEDAAGEMADRGIRAARGADLPDGVRRQLWLLRARSLVDEPDEAPLLEALAELERIDGARRADWLHARGRWLLLRDRPLEAVELFEQALAAPAEGRLEVRLAMNIRADLAQSLAHAGEVDRALVASAAALEWLDAEAGLEHPLMLLARMRHADVLRRAGRIDQALVEAEVVHELIVKTFGAQSAAAGRLHVLLATLAHQQGDTDLAIDHYEAARAIWDQSLGADHPNHVRLSLNLASLLAHKGRDPARAEALYRAALESATLNSGAHSRTVQVVRVHLSQLVISARDEVEALAVLLGETEVPIEAQWGLTAWRQAFEALHAAVGCPGPALPKHAAHRCQELEALSRAGDTS